MNEEQKKNRNEYMKEYMRGYREKHKFRINEKQRLWRKEHPEKVKEYNLKYWNKQGGE